MGCFPPSHKYKLNVNVINNAPIKQTEPIKVSPLPLPLNKKNESCKIVKCFTYVNRVKEDDNPQEILQVTLPNIERMLQKEIGFDKMKTQVATRNSNVNISSINNFATVNMKEANINMLKYTKSFVQNSDSVSQVMTKAKISENDTELIKSALSNHFLFKHLSPEIMNVVISHLFILQIQINCCLFTEGDPGLFFFIVKSGEFELTISNSQEKKMFSSGSTFGEMALLQKNVRSGTIKCTKFGDVYCLDGATFREIVHNLNKLDVKEKLYFLKLIKIFSGLTDLQLNNIARNMLKCEYDSGHQIITEGDKGESLFIVKEGMISCYKSGLEIKKINPKEYFGEISLLFETKRSLTIKSSTKSICYQLSKADLIESLGENFHTILITTICRQAFANSKLLRSLLIDNIFAKFSDLFKTKFYKFSELVYSIEESQDPERKKIIILIQGSLMNRITNERVANRSEVYGEQFITKSSQPLSSDLVASTECITLEAKWNDITAKLANEVKQNKVLSFFIRVWHLKKINIFQHLSDRRIMEISSSMTKQKFHKDETIFTEGSEGKYMYFLYKGNVKVFSEGKFLREYQDYNCFGEISMVLNQPHSATVVASTRVCTYTLSKDDLFKFMDRTMIDFISEKIAMTDNISTKLTDFYYIKTLGEGKFGHVSLVHNKKNVYAIKAVNRSTAEKHKILTKYFVKERNILLTLDHPLIIRLVKTMKNEEYIFYLMQHVNGVPMSKFVQSRRAQHRLRDRSDTRFYVGSLTSIIDYLNSKKIAHRDLKPDNVMMDEKGYLKLIDFNTSIVIKDLTTTITGTPHYIAPEILLGKGYSFSADYWSIGVIAYEIFFGFYPFGNKATDPMDVYKEVVKREVTFPHDFKSDPEVKDLIKGLLCKKVNERICSLEMLKRQKFFSEFDWDGLNDFRISAPFHPEVKFDLKESLTCTKEKYLDRLKRRVVQDLSEDSEEEDDSDYDPNWADEF